MNDIARYSGRWSGSGVVIACLCACASLDGATSPPLAPGGIHVLFIGNSLTYVNDLPGTVSALAASMGDTVRVLSVALPNLAVIDHALGLGGSPAVAAVKSDRWDVVVLQQGPTPAGLDRDTLVLAARLFEPLVRSAGGRIAALMTWPSSTQQVQYPLLFDQTRETCALEADAVGGACYPAGDAWRAAWKADPQLPLYGPDGYHPSALGTYVLALVVLEEITRRDARTLPGSAIVNGQRLGFPEATIRVLQRAAHATVVAP